MCDDQPAWMIVMGCIPAWTFLPLAWHFRAIHLLEALEIESKAPEPAGSNARWEAIIYDGIM